MPPKTSPINRAPNYVQLARRRRQRHASANRKKQLKKAGGSKRKREDSEHDTEEDVENIDSDTPEEEEDTGFIAMDKIGDDAAAAASPAKQAKGLVDFGTDQNATRVPWRVNRSSTLPNRNAYLRLHEEILDFVTFLSPTDQEKQRRRDLYEEMQEIVHLLWPGATVSAFGSSVTEMYLPSSDVDMVILNAPKGKKSLYRLARYLQDHQLVSYIEVIASARVPIVKFKHEKTGVPADICFDTPGGLESAQLIKSYMVIYPAFRPLLIVLKYFLAQRNLNETFQGGIGSYLLQLMLISYLQQTARTHKRDYVNCSMRNLGHLLIGFFELYGCKFNYAQITIRLQHGGQYALKSEYKFLERHPDRISIQNPLDSTHDVGAGAHNMARIRRILEYTYQVLRSEILASGSTPQPRRHESILSSIISIDAFLQERKGPEFFGFPPIDHHNPPAAAAAPAARNHVAGSSSASNKKKKRRKNKKDKRDKQDEVYVVYESDEAAADC